MVNNILKYQKETLDFMREKILEVQDEYEKQEAKDEAKEEKWKLDHDCHISPHDGCDCQTHIHNDDCPKFSDMSGATEGVER
jgi:hypothetical protein